MSDKHHLYSFRRCPYAMRARMALLYANIVLTVQDIELKNKPTEMLELSPKGSVPVLVTNEGMVIDESLDIMVWALEQHDPQNWQAHLNDSKTLIIQNDTSFKKALDRFKYPNRYPDEDCSSARDQASEFITRLNDRLQNNQNLNADAITLADIAIFPFIRQFAHVDKEWFFNQPWLETISWLKRHIESDLFLKVMDKKLTQLP